MFYMSEQRQSVKRRRYYTTKNNTHLTFQRAVEVTPPPSQALSNNIVYAETPQDLTYAIVTSEQTYFTKQELLTILGKLDKMYQPQFDGNCSYIV